MDFQKVKVRRLGLLVSDFDDTVSASDTISVIFNASVDARRQNDGKRWHTFTVYFSYL